MLDDAEILTLFDKSLESGYEFRKRRDDDYNENYRQYRTRPQLNRLTQRQSVSIPLMKYVVKTLLKDIDDPPMIYFTNRSNDAQKEVFYNEYWNMTSRENRMIRKDRVDKKEVLLGGRSFKWMNIRNGKFAWNIRGTMNTIVDRYVDPTNLDTARTIFDTHIYKPLSELVQNEDFDKEAMKRIIQFFATREGLIKAATNAEEEARNQERMQALGVDDVATPILGECYVELTKGIITLKDDIKQTDTKWYVLKAENQIIDKAPLWACIGETKDDFWFDHIPVTTWGEDEELTDFWCDAVGDIIRPIGNVLDMWASQLVENRTLRNFGMHYYNSLMTGANGEPFMPQTFQPVPWGWFGMPGNPNENLMKVDVPDLSESLDEMQFLIGIAEKATAATATQQGAVQESKVTLGEVQLALVNAKERVKSMAGIYTDSWEEFGIKYTKFIEAAPDMLDAVTLFKKGKNNDQMYSQKVSASDWEDELGYQTEVRDITQDAAKSVEGLQKLYAVKQLMPNNKKLDQITKMRALMFAELPATDIKEVMDEDKAEQLAIAQAQQQNPMGGGSVTQPPTQQPPMLTAGGQ